LPSPEIALPTDHFETVLWTGDGEDTKAIAASNFVMDFAWIKNRDAAENNVAWDRVRGTAKRLVVNGTNAEADISSDGNEVEFTVAGMNVGSTNAGYEGEVNKLDDDYVAWNWKGDGVAGGTLNEDGDTDSYVNVNTAAGFSIVKVTFPDALDHTFGHGLSQAPELVIGKDVEATALWWVYSKPTGNTKYLELNTSAAASDTYEAWQDTTPSASVVYITGGVYGTDEEFINYCFHSVEGYSKVGSYTANNSATDNAFVYTGFEPAWLMVKCINGGAQFWTIWDNARNPYNTANKVLHPNDNRAETTSSHDMDFYSNGFKPYNNSGPGGGGSTWQYLYYAVAESPFKYSNAR
jgi:hypothetical protein